MHERDLKVDSVRTKSANSPLTAVRLLVLGAVVLAALRVAWLGDDALITLRSALNITHGWGPGFNATESVQAYTHPLWFLIWSGIGVVTNQWILGVIALSLVCTAIAVGILVWSTRSIPRLIVAALLLILSNAFIEYSTSGLENPLSYLCAAILIALTVRARSPRVSDLILAVIAGLTAAALFLTRMDLIVLVIPIAIYSVIRFRRRWRSLAICGVSALLPIVIWFIWSKLTYAAWLPNTFEAKRNVNIPQSELIIQGMRYLWVSFEHDPASLVVIAAGVLLALFSRSWVLRSWAIGILLYIAYVVWVGGDFMAGRFMSVPVFVAVFLLAVVPLQDQHRSVASPSEFGKVAVALGIGVALAGGAALAGSAPVALANPQAARWEVDQNLNAGVSDERGSYVPLGRDLKTFVDKLSLAFLGEDFVPIGDGTGLNRQLRDLDRAAKAWPTTDAYIGKPSEVGTFCGFLGTIGIVTGPTTHLIDTCSLTDKFLAPMPYTPAEPFAWKPGHFSRQVPEGYVEAVRENDPTLLRDPAERFYLRQLWADIRPASN